MNMMIKHPPTVINSSTYVQSLAEFTTVVVLGWMTPVICVELSSFSAPDSLETSVVGWMKVSRPCVVGRVETSGVGWVEVGRVETSGVGWVEVGRVETSGVGLVEVGRVETSGVGWVEVGRVETLGVRWVEVGRVETSGVRWVEVSSYSSYSSVWFFSKSMSLKRFSK